MPREALRQTVSDLALADAALESLAKDGSCVLEGQTARLTEHAIRLAGPEAAGVEAVRNVLHRAGFEGKTPEDIDGVAGGIAPRVALEFLERTNEAVRIGRDRYVAAGIIQEVVERVREVLEESGQIGPAQLRDILGLTRKFSIPLLEWLDAQGYTVRRADVRVAGPRLTGRSAGS